MFNDDAFEYEEEVERDSNHVRRPVLVATIVSLVIFGVLIVCLIALGVLYSTGILSFSSANPDDFSYTVKVANIMTHLQALQQIADENGGNRAVGIGYNKSAEYVISQLEAAGYSPTQNFFQIGDTSLDGPSTFRQTFPVNIVYEENVAYRNLAFSANGSFSGELQYVHTACNSSDFTSTKPGFIGLAVLSNDCDPEEMAVNAVLFHASGLVIFSDQFPGSPPFAQPAPTSPQSIPVFSLSYELGQELLQELQSRNQTNFVMVSNRTNTFTTTYNVICNTEDTSSKQYIVLGSHLDSVQSGPGINDNGSGSATTLEIALQWAKQEITAKQAIRFAWWSGEELGLLGSTAYVASLVKAGTLSEVALNINMDMVASPNFFRGIYEGSEAAPSIQEGCEYISELFVDFFNNNNLAWDYTPFDGRSDYGPFIAENIPAGGLFTGAEKRKNMTGRAVYGGLSNAAYDPCYHRECDTIENINQAVLGEMSRAVASVLYTLAQTTGIETVLGMAS